MSEWMQRLLSRERVLLLPLLAAAWTLSLNRQRGRTACVLRLQRGRNGLRDLSQAGSSARDLLP
jgi:hypothetical protein